MTVCAPGLISVIRGEHRKGGADCYVGGKIVPHAEVYPLITSWLPSANEGSREEPKGEKDEIKKKNYDNEPMSWRITESPPLREGELAG